jgi:hypothetical protein
MTATDADRFLKAAQARMEFGRVSSELTIDGMTWVVGFRKGTPYRLNAA